MRSKGARVGKSAKRIRVPGRTPAGSPNHFSWPRRQRVLRHGQSLGPYADCRTQCTGSADPSAALRHRLLSISVATIDRVLREVRVMAGGRPRPDRAGV
jgi:hypothetical protein